MGAQLSRSTRSVRLRPGKELLDAAEMGKLSPRWDVPFKAALVTLVSSKWL